MAQEEAIYAAAMERIVNARREAAVWRTERMSQWDAARRELMARQQDAELAAELARMRVRKAREARFMGRRKERMKKRTAELRRAEAERTARQEPEIILEDDICFISDLDDDLMETDEDNTPGDSDLGDNDSLASAQTYSDDGYNSKFSPLSPLGENIEVEVEQGDESDDNLEVEVSELFLRSPKIPDLSIIRD